MIRPDRHTNLDYCIVNISSLILKQLSAFYNISYDNLLDRVATTLGDEAKENYPYALNFLFLLGKIIYLKDSDSFRLNNEA